MKGDLYNEIARKMDTLKGQDGIDIEVRPGSVRVRPKIDGSFGVGVEVELHEVNEEAVAKEVENAMCNDC